MSYSLLVVVVVFIAAYQKAHAVPVPPAEKSAGGEPPPYNYEDYFNQDCPVIDCPIFYDEALPCPYEDLVPTYADFNGVECLTCPVCPDDDPASSSSSSSSSATTSTTTETSTPTEQRPTTFDVTTGISDVSGDEGGGGEDGPLPGDAAAAADEDEDEGSNQGTGLSGTLSSISDKIRLTLDTIKQWLNDSTRTISELESTIPSDSS